MSYNNDAKNSQQNTTTFTVRERVLAYAKFATSPEYGFKHSPDYCATKDAPQLYNIILQHGSFSAKVPESFILKDIKSFLNCLYAVKAYVMCNKTPLDEPIDVLTYLMINCEHASDLTVEKVVKKEEEGEFEGVQVIKVDSKEELIGILKSILGKLED